ASPAPALADACESPECEDAQLGSVSAQLMREAARSTGVLAFGVRIACSAGLACEAALLRAAAGARYTLSTVSPWARSCSAARGSLPAALCGFSARATPPTIETANSVERNKLWRIGPPCLVAM